MALSVTKTHNGAIVNGLFIEDRHQRILYMSGIFIYQILNHYTKPEALDPGFLVLDNSANERPDWYEYWPIRKFLLNEALDEDSFYGFLSPKFKFKTHLTAAATHEFVSQESSTTDVVLLSPSIHLTAYHWNVFKFGDTIHPGLLKTADRFFRHIGEPTNLHALVTTSKNEVYSNYMIGKPRFWRAWLKITEQLFTLAESADDPLGADLRALTPYGKTTVQMKIFVMERITTWILAQDSKFVVRVRDPFVSRSPIYKLPGAIVCDALKIAYVTNRREEYKDFFYFVSRFGRSLSWVIRIGTLLDIKPFRACVTALLSYRGKSPKS